MAAWKYIIALCLSTPAFGSTFAEIGGSNYALPDNGIYWQDGHPSTQQMQGNYWRIGQETTLYRGISVRGSIFSLGHYALEAFATPYDYQYNPYAPNACNGPCPEMNLWVTQGGLRGFSVTLKADWRMLFVEMGPTYHEQKLSIHVFGPNGNPLDGYYVDDMRVYKFGFTAGFGIEFGKVYVSTSMYRFDASYTNDKLAEVNMPSGVTSAYTVAVGVRF